MNKWRKINPTESFLDACHSSSKSIPGGWLILSLHSIEVPPEVEIILIQYVNAERLGCGLRVPGPSRGFRRAGFSVLFPAMTPHRVIWKFAAMSARPSEEDEGRPAVPLLSSGILTRNFQFEEMKTAQSSGRQSLGSNRGVCYSGVSIRALPSAPECVPSGRGSAWLERLVRDQEVGGSNPLAPTILFK
jgi:hypothetical protein